MSDDATMPHPCYIDRGALRVVGASAIGILNPASSPAMASRKRPKSATSTSRKRKAAGKEPASLAFSSDSDEFTAVERDPEQPLSFLPKERRPIVAHQRIVDALVRLVNVALEGSNNADAEVRQTYLTIGNVAQSMAGVALRAPQGLAPGVAQTAFSELEHAALKLMSALAPDEEPMAPSTHWDLDDKHSLKGSKLALLHVVADALEGRVLASESEKDGRLNTQLLEQALAKDDTFKDDVSARAGEVAWRIYYQLAANLALSKLLVRPANLNYAPEGLPPLTRAIAFLMTQGRATVPQVARAVLFTFGSRNLKNLFSAKLLDEWEASRDARKAAAAES